VSKPDVAFMQVEHPIILPFILNIKLRLGLNIHFIKPDGDFSNYRKVIIPNGMWPDIREASSRIAKHKRVYCEVGFFPQNANVYMDPKGAHGHSSFRELDLEPLSEAQRKELEDFRAFYLARDFVRIKWNTVDISQYSEELSNSRYDFDFVFVPLQLESDTAFDLCPFENNQQIISYVEDVLPTDTLIFKIHPLDSEPNYNVKRQNTLLPSSNRDLKLLISSCSAVVGSNSTVILEALLAGKKCATYGVGFSTNHNITLECHDELEKLSQLNSWEPDEEKVDRFIYSLIARQIPIDFYQRQQDRDKLIFWLKEYDLIEADTKPKNAKRTPATIE